MSLSSYAQSDQTFPEATDRHVRRILGIESDERILGEPIDLTPSDYGGSHVIKPTGTLISTGELLEIRRRVLERLSEVGLSLGMTMSVQQRQLWDRTVGAALAELVQMGPFQTYSSAEKKSDGDAWTYLTVHVFPEFPGWRFPGRKGNSSTPEIEVTPEDGERRPVKPTDRVRGGRRNVLFRVWFRSFVLGADHGLPDGAENLTEDELDNIFGRPKISRNQEFTRAIVRAIYRNRPKSENRNYVVRELMKEIRRRYSSVHFSALADEVDMVLDVLWARAESRVK
jgi:hypothetical protein